MNAVCPACAPKTVERIDNAILHNPDKDAAWWDVWWGKEIERQMRCIREHKYTKEDE